jgi:hypothetical protein
VIAVILADSLEEPSNVNGTRIVIVAFVVMV